MWRYASRNSSIFAALSAAGIRPSRSPPIDLISPAAVLFVTEASNGRAAQAQSSRQRTVPDRRLVFGCATNSAPSWWCHASRTSRRQSAESARSKIVPRLRGGSGARDAVARSLNWMAPLPNVWAGLARSRDPLKGAWLAIVVIVIEIAILLTAGTGLRRLSTTRRRRGASRRLQSLPLRGDHSKQRHHRFFISPRRSIRRIDQPAPRRFRRRH